MKFFLNWISSYFIISHVLIPCRFLFIVYHVSYPARPTSPPASYIQSYKHRNYILLLLILNEKLVLFHFSQYCFQFDENAVWMQGWVCKGRWWKRDGCSPLSCTIRNADQRKLYFLIWMTWDMCNVLICIPPSGWRGILCTIRWLWLKYIRLKYIWLKRTGKVQTWQFQMMRSLCSFCSRWREARRSAESGSWLAAWPGAVAIAAVPSSAEVSITCTFFAREFSFL